jgi:hypothetical protein
LEKKIEFIETDKTEIIRKAIVEIANKKNIHPTKVGKADLLNYGVTDWTLKMVKGGMDAVKNHYFEKEKKEERPEHKHSDFTKEALGTIIKENDFQEGVFFITAVAPVSYLDWSEEDHEKAKNGEDIEATNIFKPGFKAMQNFVKRRNAEVVLLPMPAHVKPLEEQPLHYDHRLKKRYKKYFATEFTFNSHLKAIEAHLNPQQINPLTGLKRLRVHKYDENYKEGAEIKRFKTSIIVAHSKQMLDVVPTGNASHPRIIHSTGAITVSSYRRNRIGMIADNDHKLGGLIVEIRGDVFWIRQVQFDRQNGSFIDLGTRYHADGSVTTERAEAFKMGDIHPGLQDDKAVEAMFKLWEKIQPKRIFFEDFFDGSSISHHTEKKRLTRAKGADHFRDLPTEINFAKKVLNNIWDHAPADAELIATASNHPDHVIQYLDRGAYINDCKENYDIAHRMVVMELDGKNSLKEYLDPDNRMNWTDENEDYFVEGVQMNAHGHLGINGSRGGKLGHELAYGNAMTAHSHTPSIYHDTFTVGHMTIPRHGYNRGPSTWILCCGAVYKGGQKQLYMIIKGSSYLPEEKNNKKTI